jgi:hypothetical protein
MRFSIRDLLWATLVVAMGLGWWGSYRAIDAKRNEAVRYAQRMYFNLLNRKLSDEAPHQVGLEYDWTILDEPKPWEE